MEKDLVMLLDIFCDLQKEHRSEAQKNEIICIFVGLTLGVCVGQRLVPIMGIRGGHLLG